MTAVDERVCAPRLTSGRVGDEPYASWVRRARCAGRSAVFADDDRADDALAICGGCPVRRQCRGWALANAVDGVAGGMTADERATWRREAGQPETVVTVEDFLRPEVVSVDRTWGAAGRTRSSPPSRGGRRTARRRGRSGFGSA